MAGTWVKQTGDLSGDTLVNMDYVVGFKAVDKSYVEYWDDDSDDTTAKEPRNVDKSEIVFKLNDGTKKTWDYATAHTGTYEVQSITDVTPAENDVYALTYGDDTITTAALGAAADTDALVAALQAADGYGDLPFTIAAGTNAITLTWKTYVLVDDLATMEKTTGSGTPVSSQTTEGLDQTTLSQAKYAVAAIVTATSATAIAA